MLNTNNKKSLSVKILNCIIIISIFLSFVMTGFTDAMKVNNIKGDTNYKSNIIYVSSSYLNEDLGNNTQETQETIEKNKIKEFMDNLVFHINNDLVWNNEKNKPVIYYKDDIKTGNLKTNINDINNHYNNNKIEKAISIDFHIDNSADSGFKFLYPIENNENTNKEKKEKADLLTNSIQPYYDQLGILGKENQEEKSNEFLNKVKPESYIAYIASINSEKDMEVLKSEENINFLSAGYTLSILKNLELDGKYTIKEDCKKAYSLDEFKKIDAMLNTEQLADQDITVTAGTEQLADQNQTITAGTEQLADQNQTITAGTEQLADQNLTVTAGTEQVADQDITVTAGTEQLADQNQTITAGTEQLADQNQTITAGTEQLADQNQTITAGTEQLADQNQTITAGTEQLADQNQTITAGTEQLADQNQTITAGTEQLADQNQTITAGTEQLADQNQTITAGTEQLADQNQTITAGTKQLADQNQTITAGTEQLADQNQTITAGTKQLADQNQTITAGTKNNTVSSVESDSIQCTYKKLKEENIVEYEAVHILNNLDNYSTELLFKLLNNEKFTPISNLHEKIKNIPLCYFEFNEIQDLKSYILDIFLIIRGNFRDDSIEKSTQEEDEIRNDINTIIIKLTELAEIKEPSYPTASEICNEASFNAVLTEVAYSFFFGSEGVTPTNILLNIYADVRISLYVRQLLNKETINSIKNFDSFTGKVMEKLGIGNIGDNIYTNEFSKIILSNALAQSITNFYRSNIYSKYIEVPLLIFGLLDDIAIIYDDFQTYMSYHRKSATEIEAAILNKQSLEDIAKTITEKMNFVFDQSSSALSAGMQASFSYFVGTRNFERSIETLTVVDISVLNSISNAYTYKFLNKIKSVGTSIITSLMFTKICKEIINKFPAITRNRVYSYMTYASVSLLLHYFVLYTTALYND